MTTLHWADSRLEIHSVVVGPYDNNVFVLRCRETGEAVLIDAANEHEQLLELCQRLGVRRVLETHGHWDHIQAVPAMREAGYEVGVTAADAPRLKDVGYDVFIDDAEVIEVGRLRLDAIHNPGHTAGSICFKVQGAPLLFSGDTLFPGGPGNTKLDGGDFDTIIHSIDTSLFTLARRHDRDARPRRRHHHRSRAPAVGCMGRTWLVTPRLVKPPRSPHQRRATR